MNAKEARKIADETYSGEYTNILDEIKKESKLGNYKCYIYNHLSGMTIDKLTGLGYTIENSPSIAIQRDGLYYIITW